MITFNVIVERFNQFATNHFLINSFSHGTPEDYDIEKFDEYPLMHLVYTGSRYSSGSKTYSMEVFVLGAGPTSEGKFEVARNVVSDAEQCLEDVLADLSTGWNVFDQEITLGTASISPLLHEDHNTLVGAVLLLDLEVPYDHSSCFAPLDGVAEGTDRTEFARRGILVMKEVDGTPTVNSVRTIIVPNDSLTDNGDGEVSLTFQTGGLAERFKSVEMPNGSYSTSFVIPRNVFQDGNVWDIVLFDFNNIEVTGTADVGVVLDPLSRYISLTGMSTGMNITFSVVYDIYQDPALGTLPDFFFTRWLAQKSGNLLFPTGSSVTEQSIASVPVGEEFAEQYEWEFDLPVFVQPAWQMSWEVRSLYGNVKFRAVSMKIFITQP